MTADFDHGQLCISYSITRNVLAMGGNIQNNIIIVKLQDIRLRHNRNYSLRNGYKWYDMMLKDSVKV